MPCRNCFASASGARCVNAGLTGALRNHGSSGLSVVQGTDVPARGEGKSALGGAGAVAREATSKCAGRRAATRKRQWHQRLIHRTHVCCPSSANKRVDGSNFSQSSNNCAPNFTVSTRTRAIQPPAWELAEASPRSIDRHPLFRHSTHQQRHTVTTSNDYGGRGWRQGPPTRCPELD